MKKFFYYKAELKAELNMFVFNIKYLFTNKLKTIYIGCTDSNNIGDDAVFLALQKMLKRRCYLYKISYTKPSSGRYFRKLFFRAPDLILLGGGTLILKSKKEGFLKLADSYKKQFPNAKIAVLGSGVANPILASENGFPTNFTDWNDFLKDSIFTAVRGQNSQRILRDNLKTNVDTKIFLDPALYFGKNELLQKKKEKSIGINFCNLENRLFGHNTKDVEVFFKALIRYLLEQDWSVNLYSTTVGDFSFMKNVLSDKEFLNKKIVHHDFTFNIYKSLHFFKNIDVFVGQRLHSIVFASITHTPFFAIEYESKTSDFLNSINLSDKSMRTDELDEKIVIKKIEEMYLNINQEQVLLQATCNKGRDLQNKCLDSFFKIL